MFNRISASTLVILTLVCGAGVAPVYGQTAPIVAPHGEALAGTPDFRSFKWLSDRTVVNNTGEEIANVSDLILDRGSGRIEYAIITTGTTLGMGGREVAIPYGSLRWEAGGKDRFVLASTTEQLKQFPEYTKKSWTALKETAKDDKNALRQKLALDAASPSDAYAGTLDTAKKQRVEGEITKVERERTSTYGEQVVITVQGKEGAAKRIAMGPSWFVNASAAAPIRGEKVVAETLVLPRDPDGLLVGTSLKTGERELKLRDTAGVPAWTLPAVEIGGKNYSTSYSRYLLLSELSGKRIDCRGEESGKVHDVILDRHSGEMGFLSIDPNENFLGISDTKRLLPWSVATVAVDGIVRIDASKEMVLASPETPSDLATLNSGTHADGVYKAFGVPTPKFEVRKADLDAKAEAGSDWATGGPIMRTLESGSEKTFSGKVGDVSEVKFEKGIRSARSVTITQADGSKEKVLLGPSWYMDHQKGACKDGDTVKVEASRVTIDGKAHWLARSVDSKGVRLVLIDGRDEPVWSAR